MSGKDPLDKLSSYYEMLNSIPTPNLSPSRPKDWNVWTVSFAPLAACLLAYGFVSFCVTSPVNAATELPIAKIDRFAAQEIREEKMASRPDGHARNEFSSKGRI